ncbi:MAG TPA: hypothetical protein DCQ52_03275, partial [Acidimicrobiaceae bacterium]|nr:hypothetical protein [Acidimicrobiaceae bacterium]
MRRLVLVLACAVTLAACGDGINEGVNEGRDTRGTIDDVTLHTADTVQPPTTDPTATDPSGSDTTGSDTTEVTPNDDDPFHWEQVDVGLEEGYLEVPLDYDDPTGATVSLYVVRHLAVDPAARIGTLLVNPGGPGYGGSVLAFSAEGIYGQDLLDQFDIVGWDPRGTGLSEPAIDCIDDYDRFFGLDSSPDTPQERQALIDAGTEFGESCQRNNAELLAFIGTESSARDMDSIRRALGEEKISYFGFSYG